MKIFTRNVLNTVKKFNFTTITEIMPKQRQAEPTLILVVNQIAVVVKVTLSQQPISLLTEKESDGEMIETYPDQPSGLLNMKMESMDVSNSNPMLLLETCKVPKHSWISAVILPAVVDGKLRLPTVLKVNPEHGYWKKNDQGELVILCDLSNRDR